LRATANTLPIQLQKIQLEYQTGVHDYERHKQLLSEKEKDRKQYYNEITKGLEYYKDRLAMQFVRKGGNRLRFLFTSINPNDEDYTCYFGLALKDNKYVLEECEPKLPQEELDVLIEQVNSTQNLSQYVIQMRQKFKKLFLE